MARRLRDPPDVEALSQGVATALTTMDKGGRKVGDCRHGVFAFYDYDGEPIYVGQTSEKLRARIRRHLTNWRTDAVAMNVLDPFEVAEIEMWPFWDSLTVEKRGNPHDEFQTRIPQRAGDPHGCAQSRLTHAARGSEVLRLIDTSTVTVPPTGAAACSTVAAH